MLNRLYKTNEFCRIKCRMHNDRVIFALNQTGLTFVGNLTKLSREDHYASES